MDVPDGSITSTLASYLALGMDFHFCHLNITIWQVWGFFFHLLGGRRDMLVSSQVYKLNHIVKINTLERFFDNIRDSRGKWKLVIAQVFEHQHHECGGDHRDCGFYLILHSCTLYLIKETFVRYDMGCASPWYVTKLSVTTSSILSWWAFVSCASSCTFYPCQWVGRSAKFWF